MLELLEPWDAVDPERAHIFEAQLARELASTHELAREQVRAIAKRCDNDDVLFELSDGAYAVVHLTWSRHPQPRGCPTTKRFASLQDWVERRMKPDHDDYMCGEEPP